MKVLSIDAWRYGSGWTWNALYTVGEIDKALFETLANPRKQLKWFRDEGYLTAESAGKVAIDDDGYNIVVTARGTGQPLFAIEYGPEY